MVVHLSGKNDVSSEFAFVKLENFWKVVGNRKAKKNNKKDNKRTYVESPWWQKNVE